MTGFKVSPPLLKQSRWLIWVGVFLLAAALRLPGPDWDMGIAAHPDERFLLDVAQTVPLWGDVCTAEPAFPYGHLPVYLARVLVRVAPTADPLYATRLLSGLMGVLAVALTGALGRALASERASILASLLLALSPFAIQQAHFYTVDSVGLVLASAAVLTAVRQRWLASGALAGLALACKLSLAWCGVPLLFAVWCLDPPVASSSGLARRRNTQRLGLALLLAFISAAPWSILRPVACWRGPVTQVWMAAGRFDFPYTRQYAGTLPYLYPLVQMSLWGVGAGTTLFGVLAVGLALLNWRRMSLPARVFVVWVGVYFVAMAGLYVKFPRYLWPLYPAWAALAAWGITKLRLPRVISVIVVALTAVPGLAQALVYGQPHPWIAASRWIYANVSREETIALETWDHPLPVPLPEGDPTQYTQVYVPVFETDSIDKKVQLDAALRDSDVLVLASRRGYSALWRDPVMWAWYQRLFKEREAIVFSRCPRIGPVAFSDDPVLDAGLPVPVSLRARCGTPYVIRLPHLDESFRVYDAPTVWLFLSH